MKHFLFIIFFFIAYLNALSVDLYHNNKKIKIKSIEINGIEYATLTDIKPLFSSDVMQENNNEIIFRNSILRVAPGSFFIFYEDDKEIKINQMSSPAISNNSKTYVPLLSFVKKMITDTILDVSLQPKSKEMESALNNSKLELFKIRNIYSEPRDKEEMDYEKEIDNSNIEINNTVDKDYKIEEIPKQQTLKKEMPPNYYFLPDGLIRNELQDTIRAK